MTHGRYRAAADGTPHRQVEATRVIFDEARSFPGRQVLHQRALLLLFKKHEGNLKGPLNVIMTHREAFRMLRTAAACLHDAGSEGVEEVGRALMGDSGLCVGTGEWTPEPPKAPGRGTRSRTRGPSASERLLDNKAFREPEAAVAKLEPVEALKLLEETEPEMARFAERRLGGVLRPIRKAEVPKEVLHQVHREAVTLLVTSLLTLRKAYRDLYADVLPDQKVNPKSR